MRIGRRRRSAVEAVVALLRAGFADAPPGEPLAGEPPWEEAVAVASAGLVLPALAAGARRMPGGLEALGEAGRFLAAMEAANAARNARLIERLVEAAASLDRAGIPTVALKGAVFALEEPGHAPWRFLGDLDLLVPADRIGAAVAALEPLSYQAGGVPDLGAELHHAPPLHHGDSETVVELHTRLFPGAGNALLPPERLLAAAEPLPSVPGLAVPPRAERMVHLIAHAQIANRRFARRTLSLRDALDFAALMRRGGVDLEAVAARFAAHGHGPAAAGFLLAMNRLLGEPFAVPLSARSGAGWAEAAIVSLLAPARLRRRALWESLSGQAARLLDREVRRRAWAGLRDPARRRQVLQRTLFGWRNIR